MWVFSFFGFCFLIGVILAVFVKGFSMCINLNNDRVWDKNTSRWIRFGASVAVMGVALGLLGTYAYSYQVFIRADRVAFQPHLANYESEVVAASPIADGIPVPAISEGLKVVVVEKTELGLRLGRDHRFLIGPHKATGPDDVTAILWVDYGPRIVEQHRTFRGNMRSTDHYNVNWKLVDVMGKSIIRQGEIGAPDDSNVNPPDIQSDLPELFK